MRRPVMYLAGLLLATGASLALAGPASAAPSHPSPTVQATCKPVMAMAAETSKCKKYRPYKNRYFLGGYPYYGGYNGYGYNGYGYNGYNDGYDGYDADVYNSGVYSNYNDSSVDQVGLVNLNGSLNGLL